MTRPTAMTSMRSAGTNRLLAGLPALDRHRLLDRSRNIEMGSAEVIYEPGERIHYVYFPTGASISLVGRIDDLDQLQVGLVGDEGMLGTPLVLAVTLSPSLARVQDAGTAWQIDAASFRTELARSIALRGRLQHYVYVVMCQAARMIACTRFHVVEARLARWLLMTRDRVHSNRFHSTHESLASTLGVRRAGVTHAAGVLQQKELISYSRGDIIVLDPRGLEAASCACYRANRDIYALAMQEA